MISSQPFAPFLNLTSQEIDNPDMQDSVLYHLQKTKQSLEDQATDAQMNMIWNLGRNAQALVSEKDRLLSEKSRLVQQILQLKGQYSSEWKTHYQQYQIKLEQLAAKVDAFYQQFIEPHKIIHDERVAISNLWTGGITAKGIFCLYYEQKDSRELFIKIYKNGQIIGLAPQPTLHELMNNCLKSISDEFHKSIASNHQYQPTIIQKMQEPVKEEMLPSPTQTKSSFNTMSPTEFDGADVLKEMQEMERLKNENDQLKIQNSSLEKQKNQLRLLFDEQIKHHKKSLTLSALANTKLNELHTMVTEWNDNWSFALTMTLAALNGGSAANDANTIEFHARGQKIGKAGLEKLNQLKALFQAFNAELQS